MRTPRIAAKLFNAPLLVTADVAETIASNLAERFGVDPIKPPQAALFDDGGDDGADEPYSVSPDGIATIAVHGELVNRGSWLTSASGMTSYQGLKTALRLAEKDPAVRAILLDVDSPGGEAAGAMETAEVVREVSRKKKTVAFVDSLAASAAYAIAAAASEIVATPSATLGSIGVVYLHLDRSKAIADRGVKPTLIHAGKFKVDGNSMEPLGEEAKARIKTSIDGVYALFVESVGKHRPELGEAGARATEAGLYMGQQAVDAKLADRVGTLETATQKLARKSPFSLSRTQGKTMSDDLVYTQAAHDAAVANAVAAARRDAETSAAAALAEAVAAASRAASSAERARIKSMLDGEAAKDRGALARHFALSTDMSPEAAATALGAAAAEAKPSRLSGVPLVDLKPESSQASAPANEVAASWAAAVADVNKRTLRN